MTAADTPSFGLLLRQWRRAALLTQEELAERAGMSVETISVLERGISRSPYRATITSLADALGLNQEDRARLLAAARPESAAVPMAAGDRSAPAHGRHREGGAADGVFRGQLLRLRGRSGLTQRALATLVGIGEHAIQQWEAGRSYPSAARLRALIALYLQRGVFLAGDEVEEARTLWEALRREASQRIPPFDAAWFATLHPAAASPEAATLAGSALPAAPALSDPAAGRREPPPRPRPDWGEAPDVAAFQGRTAELATLERWLLGERCRVVALLGLGGIGKTALATRLAQDLAPQFAGLCWRSLRNAPPPEEWVGAAIAALAPVPPLLPAGLPARLGLLLGLLRERRCLLVLDNLETVLAPGAAVARYRDGYEGYGEVLRQLGESSHQSTLLLTAREAPPELAVLEGEAAPVRGLRLGGLDTATGRTLLQHKGLVGDEMAWQQLIGRYGGNPLALKVVGQTIVEVFGGAIGSFLAYATEPSGVVFGGLRRLLDEQVARLSPLSQSLLSWLAIEREPVEVTALAADVAPGTRAAPVLEALEELGRRSLLERGAQGGTHTLQPVVLDYATERLVAEVEREVVAGEPALLVSHALIKAQARDYVRRSQEQLIGQPLLDQLHVSLGSAAVERRLLDLLMGWRERPPGEQGYGPGNVVNLLRLLRGDLRGLDLSRLALRQAYLAEVEAQDASLVGAHLAETVLAEAFDSLTAVALSADGAYLAASTTAGEVRLWRVADRTPLLAVPGHSGVVRAVALSGDGRVLASGGFDGTVKLWEARDARAVGTPSGENPTGVLLRTTGRLLATLQGHSGGVWGVALSADGRLVASGSDDGTARLWDGESGRLLATLQGHSGGVWGVALSADGRLAASGGFDATVRLWEVATGRLLVTLRGHSRAVRSVALSAQGALVASGGQDGAVRLWEVASGQLLGTLLGHSGGVWGVALSGDGQVVASGGQDGTVRLWEALGGRPLATLQGHSGGVLGVALSGDGQVLASGSQDGTVRLWEAPGGRPLASLQGHSGAVRAVALSGDGRLLASGGFDGIVRLWDVASGGPLASLQGHRGAVRAVALSGDGRLLASGSFDGTVRLWDVASRRLLATLQGHRGGIEGVALAGDGGLLASSSQDGTVRLWEARSGQMLATLHGHTGLVWGVAMSADGQVVASGGFDGTVRLWEAPSGRALATLQSHIGGIFALALSADGQVVASGGFDGTVKIWEVPSGQLRATLQGHTSAVWGLALSRDGGLVASGSIDGTVTLWEAGTGASLRTLRAERRYERLDITGLSGVTAAQHAALLALGAVEQDAAQDGKPSLDGAAPVPPSSAPGPTPAPASSSPRPAARTPTNLPPARTTFVGRTADVAALTEALAALTQPGARLLTLSGLAGSGKTRLALAVAEAVREAYVDGVWLVELAALPAAAAADLTVVASAALTALGLPEQPGQDLLDTLVAHLQPRRLLLVLDNCEHLVAACAALTTRLLAACPQLQVLTTSQLPLGSAPETVWRVAALGVPDPVAGASTAEDLQRLGQADAVQLFVARTQAVQPGFRLSVQNAAAQQAEESEAIFRGLQAGPSLAEVLVTLGRIRGAQGDATAAQDHLAEALRLASAQGPRFVVAAALDALGVLAAQQRQEQHAVQLLAAAAQVRQAMGTPVHPADRPEIEAALAAARAALGEAAFAEAWATGQAPPMERIIAHEGATLESDRARGAG